MVKFFEGASAISLDDRAQDGRATPRRACPCSLLEQNSVHFNEAREKLEKWADDMVVAAEKALTDTKERSKALRRQARQAVTLEEQHEIQKQLAALDKQQRRQRQEIFATEDEIVVKRDAMVESLEKRLSQRTTSETLFTMRWSVQ